MLTAKFDTDKEITCVTGNVNKWAEIQALVGDRLKIRQLDIDRNAVESHINWSLVPEIQGSLEEIARTKCIEAAKQVEGPVLIDDASLSFVAMNGMPGPYVKYFVKAIGIRGLIKLLQGYTNGLAMKAVLICVLAYAPRPGVEPVLFKGELPVSSRAHVGITFPFQGRIVDVPRGPENFPLDAIFEPEGSNGRTLGEMDFEERVQMNNRFLAFQKFFKFIDDHEAQNWRLSRLN